MCLHGLIKRVGSTAGNKELVYSNSAPGKKWRSICNLASADNRDTLIRVGPEVTFAHSLVLAAASPFMEAAFRFGGLGKAQKVVDLTAVLSSEISLNRIIGHFYCRWVKLDDEFLPEILDASAFLMCETLTFKCSQYLLNRLSAENCFSTWIVAEMYCLPHLSLVCRDFLRELIPSVSECINVEKIPEWFWEVLLESMGSELCGSAFKLVVQLQKWLMVNSDRSDLSKLLLSFYFNEDSCFSKICSQGVNQTSGSFATIVKGFDLKVLTEYGSKTKETPRHEVVLVKEEGDPSIALYCVVGKCWTSLTLPQDYGSIIGVVNRSYLVFLCSKTHKVTLYHMPTAQTFPIRNVFSNYLSWMETYNLSRAYFVSDGKLYIAFSTRNADENTVLLNLFFYCLTLKKWKPCFHIKVPGTWNMCNIQALTTEDGEVYVVMHAYYFNLLATGQFPSGAMPASNCQSFIFCMEPKRRKMKRFCTIPRRNVDKPVFILNKKEYILLDHKLYQSHDKPLTWSARLQLNNTGDEICYNIPLSATPVPRVKAGDISGVFCVTHMYMSSNSLVVAQHRAPTILWVFTFHLHSRKLVMLPPVPVNATSRNIQVSSFYSPVPLSSMLKKTVKSIIRDKCYFKDMTFEDCSSGAEERDKT